MNEFNLQFSDSITTIAKLEKCKEPLISNVKLDEATKKINECFDFDFDGTNKFYPYEFNEVLQNLDFNILCIVGASGSGKSTFSKYYGIDKKLEWDNSKCILSNFDNVDEGIEKLCAVGLNSIPTWAKSYEVLSVGEKFRASLARKLKDNCVIDEFTSNVDRNVALSCSKSIGKYIRQHNIKKCVFISCHKDFIDVLCPDYVIDLDDEKIYDTRRLPCRKFELSIYEQTNKREIWRIFEKHHYLSSDINVAAKCFCAYLNNQLVACCYVLPQPGVRNIECDSAFRVHRLVVLPDYQGLGIGSKLLEYVCNLYKCNNKMIYLRTSNIKLINYMLKSEKWFGNGKMMHSQQEAGKLKNRKINFDRLSSSFKYVEKANFDDKSYKKISFPKHNEDKIEKMSIFDFI